MSTSQQILLGNASATGGYEIERSLRFNSADSAYLNRTPASAGNRKTWTYSFWIKRSKLTRVILLGAYTSGSDTAVIEIEADQINWYDYLTSSYQYDLRTTQVLRDPSAWYHIMCVLDTTQATSSNRNKIYINGSLVTALTIATYPSQNLDGKFNTAVQHSIGTEGSNVRLTFDGYQTETYFIDGSALDPTSFGEFNSDTGVWQPKAYTGSYGTNGFYLNFSDNASTTTLGDDLSGNGNDWTTNNFSVTAGAGNDSLVDTPTPYGTDTGVGGEVRGNYCTWNGVGLGGGTLSNGNLDGSFTIQTGRQGTFALDNGSWYWETTVTTIGVSDFLVGIISSSATSGVITGGAAGINVFYQGNGNVRIDNSVVTTVATYTSGDVIGIAYNGSTRSLSFYKNNSLQTTQTATANYSYVPWVCTPASGTSVISTNFGQRPFAYTAPSGFKALCTQNLPEPTIVDGGEYFNTILYTGTGSSNARTGVGFQPDWVWIKERNAAADHGLYDAVRGVQNQLESNTTTAETAEATGLTAFGTDGFTVGALAQLNTSGDTYVAWNWKANGAGVSNTAGTITSTVSVNTTSGFSIVTYTGNLTSGATVGHGLGVAPAMVIQRNRITSDEPWFVYHASLGATKFLRLNGTNAEASQTAVWNDTAPSSTVVTIGNNTGINGNSQGCVLYCFAAVSGYSAFGSYTGNGSADGPFIYTGFRARYILIKRTDTTDDWFVYDTARSPYNAMTYVLSPNSSAADTATSNPDDLSNGFKLRGTSGGTNGSGSTYIYAAFAENPFKYSLAR